MFAKCQMNQIEAIIKCKSRYDVNLKILNCAFKNNQIKLERSSSYNVAIISVKEEIDVYLKLD